MCNLYSMTATVDEMKKLFGGFEGDRANVASYPEIYPGRMAPVLRKEEGALRLDEMQWGFPGPQAAKGRPVTNVRNLASPFWRSALANPARRCLVPVTRFSEWSQKPDPATGRKVKHWFGLKGEGESGGDALLAFAGLYEFWRDRSAAEDDPLAWLVSFTIITTEADPGMDRIHDRQPLVLERGDHARWLDPDLTDPAGIEDLLAFRQPGRFAAYPISTAVGATRNNGPGLLEPLPESQLVGVVDPETGEVIGHDG